MCAGGSWQSTDHQASRALSTPIPEFQCAADRSDPTFIFRRSNVQVERPRADVESSRPPQARAASLPNLALYSSRSAPTQVSSHGLDSRSRQETPAQEAARKTTSRSYEPCHPQAPEGKTDSEPRKARLHRSGSGVSTWDFASRRRELCCPKTPRRAGYLRSSHSARMARSFQDIAGTSRASRDWPFPCARNRC